jgi:hypothetical protein
VLAAGVDSGTGAVVTGGVSADTLADALADALAEALADAVGDALADAVADGLAGALADALADALAGGLASALAEGDACADQDAVHPLCSVVSLPPMLASAAGSPASSPGWSSPVSPLTLASACPALPK